MIHPGVTLILINNLNEHADGRSTTLEGILKLLRALANRTGDRINMSKKPLDNKQLRDTLMRLNSVWTTQNPIWGQVQTA